MTIPRAALPPHKGLGYQGFKVVGAQYVDMKDDTPTFDEYRTGYISERWDVPDNAAKALQLFEVGYTISGAAKHLPVTESTVKGYHRDLMDKIHENVVFSLAGTGRDGSFDVWGKRNEGDAENYVESLRTLDYQDGVAHAKEVAENTQATDRQSQLDPEFREREKPLNKGVPLDEIPKELITIAPNVEVEQ